MPTFQHNTTSGFEPSNFLNSFFRTVKAVLLSPAQFYDSVKGQKGLQVPFIFLSCCALVHTFVVGISLQNGTVVAVSLINGIAMPFATAGLLFLVLTRLFKTPGTYEQTFMVVAYSGATALFSWIPLAGFFFGALQGLCDCLGAQSCVFYQNL
jgi:hypothetical protein